MTDHLDLICRLIGDDPLTYSQEGLDDGCFFCGADDRYNAALTGRWADHESDCPWVEAMRLLGKDLGRHTVKPRPCPRCGEPMGMIAVPTEPGDISWVWGHDCSP